MGFRDLVTFNKSLLAKQIWRILNNPDLLISRVLKAKYYKNSSIMEASVSSNPSFIWRSLIWSRDVLDEGLVWKIGNGESINIRKDKWITTNDSGKISSSLPLNNITKVSDLLLSPTSWDIHKLKMLFLPFEVEVIIRTPLMGINKTDSHFLKHEKKKGK